MSAGSVLSTFKHIPYENLSKIFRLGHPRGERPRRAELFTRDMKINKWGGTCFSLTWEVIKQLHKHKIDAWPVKANMSRGNFPHFALVYQCENTLCFSDPAYMIFESIPLKPDESMTYSNGIMNYELISSGASNFKLFSGHLTHRDFRYEFSTKKIKDDVFTEYWIQSFDMMNALVAARVVENKFIYISGDYVQIRTKHSVEKYRGSETAFKFIQKYFNFSRDEILLAQSMLDSYKN